jgi:hypothetical protein
MAGMHPQTELPGDTTARGDRAPRFSVVVALMALVALATSLAIWTGSTGGSTTGPGQPLSINPTYSCGRGPRFTIDALSGPADAQTRTDPAAAALRARLEVPSLIPPLPTSGWVRVYDAGDVVEFLAPSPDPAAGYDSVTATRNGSTWTSAAGICVVQSNDDSYGGVAWDLAASPSPRDSTVQVLLHADNPGCVTPVGWTIDDRPESVTITFWERPTAPPGMGCLLTQRALLTMVTLSEPLGNRTLFDGSQYPLRTARVQADVRPDGTWQP